MPSRFVMIFSKLVKILKMFYLLEMSKMLYASEEDVDDEVVLVV